MYALVAFVLIVLALPPLSVEIAAYLFFIPLLFGLDRFRSDPGLAGIEASLLGACIGAYVYFGAYAEGLGLYVLCIVVLAGLFGVCGLITARILQLRSLPLSLLIPVIWAAGEQLVNRVGLPFEFALTLDDSLTPLQLASLGGPWLVTMFVLFVQVAVFLGVQFATAQAWRRAGACAGLVIAAVTWVHDFGQSRVTHYDKAPDTGTKISVAQTSLPPQLLHHSAAEGHLEIIVDQHRFLERKLRELSGSERSIAVWPESAIPGLRLTVPNDTRATKIGFHSVLHTYGMSAASDLVSEVHVVDARGRTTSRTYKVRPVPLAEKDVRAGDKLMLHKSLGIPLGTLVCYESAFPDLARHLVSQGARWLAVLTNDAFEWPSFLSSFNHSMARLRAIENGVTVARSANGGVSAIFSPSGAVQAEVSSFHVDIATSTVGAVTKSTVYTRHGRLLDTLLLIIGAALAAAATVPSANGVRGEAARGGPYARFYPVVATILVLGAALSANFWQFHTMAGAHALKEALPSALPPSDGNAVPNELSAALKQVHRRYGFVAPRQPSPESREDLVRWAAAHGLEPRTGELSDTHPALRYAMTGLVRLASGDLAVVTARRDDDFRLYFPNERSHRWIALQRLTRMQRGPVLWLLPKTPEKQLLSSRTD